jgi:hypothetical protein
LEPPYSAFCKENTLTFVTELATGSKRSISKLPQCIRISQFFAISNSCVGRIKFHINNQAPRIQRLLVAIRTDFEMRGTMVTHLAIVDILTLRYIDILEYSLQYFRFAISVEIRLRFSTTSSNTQISVGNWLGEAFQHPPWESTVSLLSHDHF